MFRSALRFAIMGLLPLSPAVQAAPRNACDLNQDGVVDRLDIQLATAMYLGLLPCIANIDGPGVCDRRMVQLVINAANGEACVTAKKHTVALNWMPSKTPGVKYNVYRANTSRGPYTKLTASPQNAVAYVDNTVIAGQTYYYVATAVNNNGESGYSNEAKAVVPYP